MHVPSAQLQATRHLPAVEGSAPGQQPLSEQQQRWEACKALVSADLAQAQTLSADLHEVYAELVSRVKTAMDRVEEDGQDADVQSELERACLTLVMLLKSTFSLLVCTMQHCQLASLVVPISS